MLQEIYIIDENDELLNMLKETFKDEKDYKFQMVRMSELDVLSRNIPAMIIVNEDIVGDGIIDLCKTLRANEDNSITPIIVVSSNSDINHRIDVLKTSVEYYIPKPVNPTLFMYTVKNITRLLYTNRRVSPLTGLPGNVQIQAEMKSRLLNKEYFAILYFDLDNFKAYNDVYGFSNGDEIIKFTARTIVENIHASNDPDCFVGHIGGDDFIAIMSGNNYEDVCKNVVSNFDSQVLEYYNEIDSSRGYVEVANRKGIVEQFPLTSISIGVVECEPGRFKNPLEIGEIGAQVKHKAKTILGSVYVINKRKR